jgi:aspartate aminotransferase
MEQLLSNRVKSISESATLKMSRLANELKDSGTDVINLSLGEPDFDTPDHIKDAAAQALKDGYTKYTPVPGLLELREAICKKLKRDNHLHYQPGQIVVSNGAKQTISNLAMALLNPGDEAAILTPYWVSYFDIVGVAEGVPVAVSAGIEQDYKVTPAQLEASITSKTKFVLFSSPCNPTGSVYTRAELEGLAEVIRKHKNLLVISDEIYEYINFTDEHWSIARCEGMEDRAIVVNGFSKGFAMTGWRLGYMAAPQWLATACSKIQSQCTSGATSFGQKAAVAALEGDMSSTKFMCETYLRRKKLMRDGLNQINGIRANDPQGAFYIFPDISSFIGKSVGDKKINNSDDLAEYLLTTGHVATVSGAAFGNPHCIRLSFAASDENLNIALARMKDALGQLA